MYQIKFLKPLQISRNRKLAPTAKQPRKNDLFYEISTTFTISNDLGEEFFHGDAEVGVQVVRNGECVGTASVGWAAGKRSVEFSSALKAGLVGANDEFKLKLQVDKATDGTGLGLLRLQEAKEMYLPSGWEDLLSCGDSRDLCIDELEFLSTESQTLRIPEGAVDLLPLKTERMSIRHVGGLQLNEELSGSIARHLWDAGIIFNNLGPSELTDLLGVGDRCNVLELGTGIGLVGIHLSKILKNSAITVTDLPDAREICELNIKDNACGSSVQFAELDWESNEPTGAHFDAIVITDCTYNPLYYDSLINVLRREATRSTKVVLVHKFREPFSESAFFSKVLEVFDLQRQLFINARGQSVTHLGVYVKR